MLNEIFFQIIPKDLEDAVDLMEAEEVFVEIVEVVAIEVECKDIIDKTKRLAECL